MIWLLLYNIQALSIVNNLITLWILFQTPYFKSLNDARVASACSYVRTCRRLWNSPKIATTRDFHLPGSFFLFVNSTKTLTYPYKDYAHIQQTMQIAHNLFTACTTTTHTHTQTPSTHTSPTHPTHPPHTQTYATSLLQRHSKVFNSLLYLWAYSILVTPQLICILLSTLPQAYRRSSRFRSDPTIQNRITPPINHVHYPKTALKTDT